MIARDRGELMSIRQMIEHSAQRHGIGSDRIFIQGLSAGGAMANAMLVTYPDLFAAGQVVGALPYGAARDAMSALSVMKSGSARSRQEWGNLARVALGNPEGALPAISIWQGSADRVVSPRNAEALLAQWLDLYELPEEAGEREDEAGGTTLTWRDDTGRVRVQYRLLSALDHGLPVIAGPAGQRRQPYMLEGALAPPSNSMRHSSENALLAARCCRSVLLDRNAVLTDPEFDTIRLLLFLVDVDTQADHGNDECADDEVEAIVSVHENLLCDGFGQEKPRAQILFHRLKRQTQSSLAAVRSSGRNPSSRARATRRRPSPPCPASPAIETLRRAARAWLSAPRNADAWRHSRGTLRSAG